MQHNLRFRYFYTLLVCIVASGSFNSLPAQSLPTGFSASNVGSNWNTPVGTAFNNAGTKLFVWQKGGKVYVCNWNPTTKVYNKQAVPVLDISEEVGDWRDHGMLGFALDPNFDVNGLIYVLYVVDRHYLLYFGTPSYNPNANEYFAATIGRITRYKLITNGSNQLVADANTRTILLGESKTTGIPILYESHGIGSLVFADDGTLLVSAGDGGSYNVMDAGNVGHTYYAQALADGIIRPNENVGSFKAQMVNSLNGKILRIDPSNGNGVSSNPYYDAAAPRAASSRVWAMGLRNPFRFSIRPNTGSTNPATGDIGDLYVGDVGWNIYEELNVIHEPGANCGWPLYEGITGMPNYLNAITANKDEPNPLYGVNGCTQQYFTFQNLLKQATADNITTVYNPCNASVPIAGVNSNRFFHKVAAIDWKHGTDSARVKIFDGNNLKVAQIGSPASGVTGIPFRGNCAIGGCWYTGDMFPASYKNSYFQGDYGGKWLRKFTVQYNDQVTRVDNFTTNFAAIVSVTENPLDGSLFIVDIGTSTVKQIVYGGNKPPVVKMSFDVNYGPSPLTVNFTGNTSYSPQGGPVTYSWDFGDGSPLSTEANPSHTFTTPGIDPTKFVAILTVTDNLNQPSVDSLIISANNTPPVVNITSPVKNSYYTLGPDTTYSLIATVTDAEQPPSELFYLWQTKLRHNNHEHPEPIDNNVTTSAVISRIGCNGDDYSWFIQLTVTDIAGLSTIDSSKLFPLCSAALPVMLRSFNVTTKSKINLIQWVTESEVNLSYFLVERSYDGISFETIDKINAKNGPSAVSYESKDIAYLSGYNYYRLKMVDIDGHYKYSFTVRVFTGFFTGKELLVSPNPITNSFLLGANFDQAGNIVIRLFDMNGNVVKMQTENTKRGFNSFNIDKLEGLKPGVYVVEIKRENEVRKTKLIKAK